MNLTQTLQNYDLKNITIGVLGGHSALDVCAGAKKLGFKTLVVAQKGREQTYEKYYKIADPWFGDKASIKRYTCITGSAHFSAK